MTMITCVNLLISPITPFQTRAIQSDSLAFPSANANTAVTCCRKN